MAAISQTKICRKIYDIPEEVGMDIVEALDMLEITRKSVQKIPAKVKIKKKLPEKEKESGRNFVIQKSVIQKLNEEFVQELRNEIQNRPEFSSVTLSSFLRASRTRNILFEENILCSTLEQKSIFVRKIMIFISKSQFFSKMS